MNTYLKSVLLVGAYSCSSFSQEEVSVSDFRYPETKALDWKGGLSGSFGTSRSESSQEQNVSDNREGFLNVHSSLLFFHSKENHDNEITLRGSFNYTSLKDSRESSVDHEIREDGSDRKSGHISGTWKYAHFFLDADKFHFIGMANLDYFGSFNKSTRVEGATLPTSREVLEKSFNLSGTGFLGIGYGRMRDGTFVIRALRIIERLEEDGVIARPLSRVQVLALIDRVAHTREYVTNFERYEKFFVLDIVNELVKQGIINQEAATPFSVLKIAEVLKEQIEPRFFGWRAYYALGGRERHRYDFYSHSSASSTDVSRSYMKDRILINRFGAEFGYAVSSWTHINGKATVDIPQRVGSKFYSVDIKARAIHQIGERIDVVAAYEFRRLAEADFYFVNEDFYRRQISHYVDATVRFFLEDRISFNTSISYSNYSSNFYDINPIPTNANSTWKSSGMGIAFGLYYNII